MQSMNPCHRAVAVFDATAPFSDEIKKVTAILII